jgi:uncharacterized membrane protein YhiD involved in acid resistance
MRKASPRAAATSITLKLELLDLSSPFTQLAIALGLGLLVGLQREHAASRLAGIRTFPLITVFGVISGMLSQSFGGWVLAAALLSLAA